MSNTLDQKHIGIVGGGIAGLYAAYKLLQKGFSVTLWEASDRIGGRVCTARKNGVQYEGGAGRFHVQHKRLMRLFKELNMHHDFYTINKHRIYMKDGKTRNVQLDPMIERLLGVSKKYTRSYLQKRSLYAFMHEVLADSDVEEFIRAFGYVSEFDTSNAWDSLSVFKNDFRDEIQYYGLKSGFSALPDRLHALIKQYPRCTIHTQAFVTSYTWNGTSAIIHWNEKETTPCDYVLFGITRNALRKVKGIETLPSLKSILDTSVSRPLHRIYAKFPQNSNGKSWFDGLPRITTNNLLSYIIPIDPKNGVIMISYTDGSSARMWNQIQKQGILEDVVMTHVRKLFPNKQIPKPMWVDSWYWEEGAHYWSTSPHKYTPSKHDLTKYGFLLCGEVVSPNHQAWVEGALESVDRAIKYLYS